MGCNEDTAIYLIGLFDQGDRALLKPLLDAGRNSDAALAEALGTFYSEVLLKHPHLFLRALVSRPLEEQRGLAYLAGGTDGGGMSDDDLRDVRRTLQHISQQRRSRLALVAGICLIEINKANAAARSR